MLKLKNTTFIFLTHLIIFVTINAFGSPNMDMLTPMIILDLTFIFITLPLFIISIIWYFATE